MEYIEFNEVNDIRSFISNVDFSKHYFNIILQNSCVP